MSAKAPLVIASGVVEQLQSSDSVVGGGCVSGLTADRITLGASATTLKDNANLTYDGTNVSVAGGIKVGTGILDSNGNEIMKVTATASAVNELTVVNAATGGIPYITASGDDTNISWKATGKGTGSFLPVVRYKMRAICGSAQTLSAGVNTLNLNTTIYDTNSNFDTTNHRYTAPVTGYYFIQGGAALTSDKATSRGIMMIYKNNNEDYRGNESYYPSTTVYFSRSVGSYVASLTAGDYVYLKYYANDANVIIDHTICTLCIFLLSV